MSKKGIIILFLAIILMPFAAWAGGESAPAIVVVADTRRLTGLFHYFANVYNENIWLLAVYNVLLTAAMGSTLGFLMDFIMSRTGLDLTSRKIVEH